MGIKGPRPILWGPKTWNKKVTLLSPDIKTLYGMAQWFDCNWGYFYTFSKTTSFATYSDCWFYDSIPPFPNFWKWIYDIISDNMVYLFFQVLILTRPKNDHLRKLVQCIEFEWKFCILFRQNRSAFFSLNHCAKAKLNWISRDKLWQPKAKWSMIEKTQLSQFEFLGKNCFSIRIILAYFKK